MSIKKRIRIVVEQRRRRVESGDRGDRIDGRCSVCGRDVQMVTRQEAASFLEIGLADVDSLAAAGRIHAIFTAVGAFRVCKQSLLRNPE